MILAYRRIGRSGGRIAGYVSVEAFFRHMSALRARTVVSLDDYDPENSNHSCIVLAESAGETTAIAATILQHFCFPYARLGEACRHQLTHSELLIGGALISVGRNGEVEPWASLSGEGKNNSWLMALNSENEHLLFRSCGFDEQDPPRSLRWMSEDDTLFQGTVAAIITNYNYGHLLREAVDSINGQIVRPDEFIIVDDASTDKSGVLLDEFEAAGMRVTRNPHNLGIVENFRSCVSQTTSDYIVFLGADNRFRSDYILECRLALDDDPSIDVAYTDALLFGVLAGDLARKVGAQRIGYAPASNWDVYEWQFPDPTPETLAAFRTSNFVHGSSMYRRKAYDRVGGYKSGDTPEDHNLFYRIWSSGGRLKHVALPLLEYRQHSVAQANNQSALRVENIGLKAQLHSLETKYASAEDAYHEMSREIARLNAAFAELSVENARIASAYAEQAGTIEALHVATAGMERELARLNAALAGLSTENARVNTAFIELSAENVRIATAYAEQAGKVEALQTTAAVVVQIQVAFQEQSFELRRLQIAYSEQDSELRRVSAAFGEQDAELRRVNSAYGVRVSEVQRITAVNSAAASNLEEMQIALQKEAEYRAIASEAVALARRETERLAGVNDDLARGLKKAQEGDYLRRAARCLFDRVVALKRVCGRVRA